MRLKPAVLLVLATTLLLTSCASLMGSRNVEISLAQLQDGLARKFPFNSRFLELFDIDVSNPTLALQPDTNRVVTTMDASIAPPFIKRTWKGSFTLSGMLQIDPSRNAVILTDTRMENFAIDGMDNNYTKKIGTIGGLLAEQLLRNVPLYTFEPQEFRYAGIQFLPTKINTKPNGLVVTFEPAR